MCPTLKNSLRAISQFQCGHLPRHPKPSAKLGKGSEEALPVHTPCPEAPLSGCSGMAVARKARAAQVEIVRKKQWMSPAPPKNRKPPPSSPGIRPRGELIWQTSRGKRKRWDAKTEVEGLSAENPLGTTRSPSHSEVGAGEGKEQGLSFVSRGGGTWRRVYGWVLNGGGDRAGFQPRPKTNATCQADPSGQGARRTRSLRLQDPDRHAGRGATHLLPG